MDTSSPFVKGGAEEDLSYGTNNKKLDKSISGCEKSKKRMSLQPALYLPPPPPPAHESCFLIAS